MSIWPLDYRYIARDPVYNMGDRPCWWCSQRTIKQPPVVWFEIPGGNHWEMRSCADHLVNESWDWR